MCSCMLWDCSCPPSEYTPLNPLLSAMISCIWDGSLKREPITNASSAQGARTVGQVSFGTNNMFIFVEEWPSLPGKFTERRCFEVFEGMYGLVEDDVRSGTSRASSSIGASDQSGSAPTIERCRDTIERMLGRIKAEYLFATPATASGGASGFKTQSTVGMILNGCAIDSLVLGGPVRDARAACAVRGCRCASASAL